MARQGLTVRTKENQDPQSTRLGTMVFTIANELVNHYGKKLEREAIDEITRNLTCEMAQGPTAWAFSGKSQPRHGLQSQQPLRS